MFTTSYMSDALDRLRYFKGLGDRALAQTSDQALFTTLDPLSNSIAIVVKHLSGNMYWYWTDFLAGDGKQVPRDRDAEFEAPPDSREQVLALWESGWQPAFATLGELTEEDLGRNVTIRGQEQSAMQAINLQLTHSAYHVGQIVYLAKHFAGPNWNILTVPRRKSKEDAARVPSREIPGR